MRLLMESLISWLPLLLLISASVWTIFTSARKSTNERPVTFTPLTTPMQIHIPEVQRLGKKTVFIASVSLALIVGLGAGYAVRDHQLATHLQTYTDVAILKKVAEGEFWIWPDRMKQQHIQLCAGSVVGWQEGETLDDWTFEQKAGCKRVVSYHERLKGELDAAIQMR